MAVFAISHEIDGCVETQIPAGIYGTTSSGRMGAMRLPSLARLSKSARFAIYNIRMPL